MSEILCAARLRFLQTVLSAAAAVTTIPQVVRQQIEELCRLPRLDWHLE